MAISCSICNTELDAFSGGRCKVCRSLVCSDCIASGSTDQKNGIICKNCFAETQKKQPSSTRPETTEVEETVQPTYSRKNIALLIIGSFTLLCIFVYILTIPYITTQNALYVIEFGPDEKLQEAKEDLSNITGSYVLEHLEDLAKNGKQHTAIRAVSALGAQPNPKAVLILKQLQLSDKSPDYLQSVIVEALMENERLYKIIDNEEEQTIEE